MSEEERSFVCRSCKLSHRGRRVPDGWYTLERVVSWGEGEQAGRRLRLGLYCSIACLTERMPELAEGERATATGLSVSADPVRDRRRLIERARTMVARGISIREAGDVLGIPTTTLKAWLKATEGASS